MKGYGLPRNNDVEYPDKGDIALYGLKGAKLDSARKKRARRIWKKKARREGAKKENCRCLKK